jgi:hypothetical protein
MSGKKFQEENNLGGYNAQVLNHGNSTRTFPVETIEIKSVNKIEVKAW